MAHVFKMADWRYGSRYGYRSRSRSPLRGLRWPPTAVQDSWTMPERWPAHTYADYDVYQTVSPPRYEFDQHTHGGSLYDHLPDYEYHNNRYEPYDDVLYHSSRDRLLRCESNDLGQRGFNRRVTRRPSRRPKPVQHSHTHREDRSPVHNDRHRLVIKKEKLKVEKSEETVMVAAKELPTDHSNDLATKSEQNELVAVIPAKSVQITTFHCGMCNIYATNKDQLEEHFKGDKHMRLAAVSITDHESLLMRICAICGKHLLQEDDITGHESSDRHQKWLQIFMKEFQDNTELNNVYRDVMMSNDEVKTVLKLEQNPEGYFCEVCDVTLRNYVLYKEHVIGQKHRKMLRKNENGQDNVTLHRCDICDVDIQGDVSLKAHLNGQKHCKKISQQKSNTTKDSSNDFHCEVCSVSCTSQIDFDAHLNGKSHKKRNKNIITNE